MCCSGGSCCNGKCRCICLRCRDCAGCGADGGAGSAVGLTHSIAGGLLKTMSARKKPNAAMKPDLPGAGGSYAEPPRKNSQSTAMFNAAKNGCAQS